MAGSFTIQKTTDAKKSSISSDDDESPSKISRVPSRQEIAGENCLHTLSRGLKERQSSADSLETSTARLTPEENLIKELLTLAKEKQNVAFSFCSFWRPQKHRQVFAASKVLDAHNCLRQTPLHIAVQHNNNRAAVLLLWFGADIFCRDIYGKIPEDYCRVHTGVGSLLKNLLSKLRITIEDGRRYGRYILVEDAFQSVATEQLRRDIDMTIAKARKKIVL